MIQRLVRLGVHVAVATLLGACAADLFTPEAQPLPSPTAGDFRSEQTDKGTTFWPRYAPVEPGVEYRFNTGHCGLGYLTDFDGSFWRPMDPNGKAEDPLFFYNEDDGAITLESKNVAVYENSDQQSVTLRRIPGSVTLEGLCA